MQIKRLPLILGILALVIAALLIVPAMIDWSRYQTLAQTKVREATGYDLTIGGSLRLALLPAPHAIVKDVTLKKGNSEAFMTLEKASVRIALFPLLAGKIEVADVTLDKPVATLVTYRDGTDNFTPVKQNVQTPAVDPVTGEPVTAKAQDGDGQDIAVNGLRIKDGSVTIRNEAKASTQVIGIDDLRIKADTLSGPFDGDGDIAYNDARFSVSLSTGGYKAGESLPVQLNIEEKDNRAALKYSGVVVMGAQKEAQGEVTLNLDDLPGLLRDAGIDAAVPDLGGETKISGMITAGPQRVTMTNGTLVWGKTKFKTRLDATMAGTARNVVLAFDADSVLDLDALTRIAEKVKKADAKEKDKDKADTVKVKAVSASPKPSTLVPTGFTLPADLTADLRLSAPGLKYKNKETGAFAGHMTAAGGVGKVSVTLANVPGGGNIALAGATTTTPGEITGTVSGALQSLKTTLADWLAVVEDDVFAQPGIPQSATLDAAFAVKGNTATLNITSLSIGEPKIDGALSYTAGATPMVGARLHATSWIMPVAKGDAGTQAKPESGPATAEEAPTKMADFEINPPQLPFATTFDITVDRLTKGDLVVTSARVAGEYDGKNALNLKTASAGLSGGTVGATGRIADLKNLAGVDMQATLKTSDLEGFVSAMTGKPLAMTQKIGAFNGAVNAKGNRDAMAVAATLQALGYTVEASGTLEDPLSPDVPGAIDFRIRHADLASAIRAFSPGFGGAASGAVDIAGNAKITGKIYTITGLKGRLGASDITGSVKANLSGDVPDITADITSNTLDVGALVGVKNKTAKTSGTTTAASGAPAQADSSAGQWSNEAMDTGFLHKAKLDVKVSAGTFSYGTWTVTNARAGIAMKDGSLKVAPLSGGLYGGTLDGELAASSAAAGQPLSINFKADATNVAIGPFMQALMSSAQKRADGTGSVSIGIKGEGVSAAQLMQSLHGDVIVKAGKPVIYGMDIDKLAANIVEAFDGGWKGVLAGGFGNIGFSGGQTSFKDIDQKFTLTGGNMPVSDFRLETTNGNAIVNTNGNVNFAGWTMNLQSNVQVTQPKDVPVIGISLTGPIDAPRKNVSSQALDNLVRAKLGGKVQDLIGKKLGNDSPAGALINQFLGGGQNQQQAAPAATTPAPTEGAAVPAAPQAAPADVQPQTQKDPRQQLLEGVLNQLVK